MNSKVSINSDLFTNQTFKAICDNIRPQNNLENLICNTSFNLNSRNIFKNQHLTDEVSLFKKEDAKILVTNTTQETILIKEVKKLFVCEYQNCDKQYKAKENLSLHIKNIHLKIKPYKCRFCALNFSHRNGNFFLYF